MRTLTLDLIAIDATSRRPLVANGSLGLDSNFGVVAMINVKPMVVDFKGLRQMGWPYSLTHTDRMSATMIPDPAYTPRWGGDERLVPNPDPFPQHVKLVKHRNGHRLWRTADVLDYLESHGLPVKQDWANS